jgi:lysyl-tRNA synthetase class 2
MIGPLPSELKETHRLLEFVFESRVEQHLIQPIFITEFPKASSPLAKSKPGNPSVADRFELFVAGMELANGYSELNDPRLQWESFAAQVAAREGGDEEAAQMDEDYIRALEYGMLPCSGLGVGIDRLVMILTGAASIRDVILFPLMKPEVQEPSGDTQGQDAKK